MAPSASFFAALGAATLLTFSASSASAAPTTAESPSTPALPYRRCVAIVPADAPAARRLRDELRLAGEVIRESEAGAPSAAPTSLPCDRWVTVNEDAIAVFDTRMFSPRLLERVKGPLTDATFLRVVEVARTRDATAVATAPPAAPPPPRTRDVGDARELPRAETAPEATSGAAPQEGRSRHLVVALNPLALSFMRLSLDAEWAPEANVALRASAHAQLMPRNGLYDASFVGGGGELGVRYYSGRRGSEGFFVGPSLVGGVYAGNWHPVNVDVSYRVLGPALDVGYAALVTARLWISAGAGVQHLFSSGRAPALASPPAGSVTSEVEEPRVLRVSTGNGFQPRLLVSIGWSFD